MITSDKQFQAAKAQLDMLSKSLSQTVKKSVPDVVATASKRQIQEMMDEIRNNNTANLITPPPQFPNIQPGVSAFSGTLLAYV